MKQGKYEQNKVYMKIIIDNFRLQQYKNENDQLVKKIEKSEVEVNDLVQINQVNYNFILVIIHNFYFRYFEMNFQLFKINLINYKLIIIE